MKLKCYDFPCALAGKRRRCRGSSVEGGAAPCIRPCAPYSVRQPIEGLLERATEFPRLAIRCPNTCPDVGFSMFRHQSQAHALGRRHRLQTRAGKGQPPPRVGTAMAVLERGIVDEVLPLNCEHALLESERPLVASLHDIVERLAVAVEGGAFLRETTIGELAILIPKSLLALQARSYGRPSSIRQLSCKTCCSGCHPHTATSHARLRLSL
mmetsp:Transcript_98549/g.283267  ORF Transcript_98549/g.283267 Transcript_98549/m.283267 type:complete len:211 (-) Transcript_98549:12-644(-)